MPDRADPRAFLVHRRRVAEYRPAAERLSDNRHQQLPPGEPMLREQAGRCMACAVPFCHTGCPLGNVVPDWHDHVRAGRWREASDSLHATNNFPELTGRLCPAPCEEACVLALNDDPVTIRQVELGIADRAFQAGWVRPRPAGRSSGHAVAVVGSGPAGLAAAQQLTRAGHAVTVFERDPLPGGLLRFGIPDFKLEKTVVDRRLDQMRDEGTTFETGADVGRDITAGDLRDGFDAIVLATGAQRHRPLDLGEHALRGVHHALDYLIGRNRALAGLPATRPQITAESLRVVIVGGGDTSADCLGDALREQAASVIEIAHGPTPPRARRPLQVWPRWPFVLRSYGAHEEGGERDWQLEPLELLGRDGRVVGVRCRRVEFPGYDGVGARPQPVPTGEEVVLDADLVLVAIGFSGVEESPLFDALGVTVGRRNTIAVAPSGRATEGVFAAGDCVRGADLIVSAIADGRAAAAAVGAHLAERVQAAG